MNNIQDIIKFFRDCYQFEFSADKVSNFYSKNVSLLYAPKSFRLLNQKNYMFPVDTEWGKEIYAELELSSSEKKLVCGSFFLKGSTEVLGRKQKLFTPLFIHDVYLEEEDEVFFLKVDQESISVNPVAINCLNGLDEKSTHLYDDVSAAILNVEHLFCFDGYVHLTDMFKDKYPSLNTALINERIQSNARIENLESIYKSRKTGVEKSIYPDVLIGLVEKPKKSKGVINELEELSQRKHTSTSVLTRMFSGELSKIQKTANKEENKHIIVPASLSTRQEKIIHSARQSDFSVVIGPPGTGKSFSIAALAIQAMHEGKKVLIASKNEQACQVVHNKIRNDIGIKNVAVNASKARFRMTVATRLRNIISGMYGKIITEKFYRDKVYEVVMMQSGENNLAEKISSREKDEINWGKILLSDKGGIVSAVKKYWVKYKHESKEKIWDLKYELHEIEDLLKKREIALIKLKYSSRLYDLLHEHRPELQKYEKVFSEDKGNVIKEIFSSVDFDAVLEALPIWICKSSDVSNIVPLEEDIFDLLIIDEASQCDIASSIPLMYRAKSVVIVGDPNQLRHVSFISKNKEEATKRKYNIQMPELEYRKKSVLDQVNLSITNQDNIIFLNEHFRSMPDIIHFSNQQFYSGQLQIMTDHLDLEKNSGNLKIHHVENGERNEKGENEKEAIHVVSAIKKVITAEEELSRKNCSSIGVISPFRAQVNLLKKMIKNEIDVGDIKKHHILVGTPFSFQGEERDMMLLSFVVDDNSHFGTLRYLEKPDVFNVSVTRAKYFQDVFVSINPKKLNGNTLLAQYISHDTSKAIKENEPSAYDDFLREVKSLLKKLDAGKLYIDRSVCGTQLDIVIVQENRTLGIDLIGYPGMFERQLSIEELSSLERAKINIFLLPFSTWHLDRNKCEMELREFILGRRKK